MTSSPRIHATIAHLAVPLDSIRRHPENARTHDLPRLRESLRRNGQYRTIVVNKRDTLILAGNGTHEAMELEGAEEIAVEWVDTDDDLARRILAVDNRANDLAGYDYPALAALLDQLAGDLDGTGYDEAALAEVNALAQRAATAAAQAVDDVAAPDAFAAFDEDLETAYRCPKCRYEWSGKAR